MKCPACQKSNASSSRFCSHCGLPLKGGADSAKASPGRAAALESIQKQIHRGETAAALAQVRMLAAADPDNAALLCGWGHALYFSGKLEEASQKYQAAVERNPRLWEAHLQAGTIAYSRRRFQEAADSLRRFFALKPEVKGHFLTSASGGDAGRLMAGAHLYLGMALRELGQPADATQELEQAADLDPESPLAYGVLGDLGMAAHQYDRAIRAYGKALDRVADGPSRLALRNDLAVALFRAGRHSEAAEQFKSVILEDPQNSNAIYNLGVLYLKQGSQTDLKRDWQDFLKADQAASILVGLTRSMVEAAKSEGNTPEGATLLGTSPAMQSVYDLIRRAATGTANVLILGENGTGKERVARAIHGASPRASKPFVAINCGALPEGLLESELFGYEKGAFTGAYASKPGRFELAEGGTLFLDEIGDLNLALQVKLLRVIQERSFERLGGTKTLQADVRLIAATHQDLKRSVADGSFREDLFYRLYVVAITIPPLRERRQDIPLLAHYFLERFNRRNGKAFTGLHPEALRLLEAHAWPGNVRELENVIERAVALYDGDLLLPSYLQLEGGAALSAAPNLPPPGGGEERQQILDSLRMHRFKVPKAAQALGISRATLYRKLEKYQIDPKSLD